MCPEHVVPVVFGRTEAFDGGMQSDHGASHIVTGGIGIEAAIDRVTLVQQRLRPLQRLFGTGIVMQQYVHDRVALPPLVNDDKDSFHVCLIGSLFLGEIAGVSVDASSAALRGGRIDTVSRSSVIRTMPSSLPEPILYPQLLQGECSEVKE